MDNSIVIPTTIIGAALISFIANYFAISKRVENTQTRLKGMEEFNKDLMDEIKGLRGTRESVAIQKEKLEITTREVEQLKTMQETINLLQLRIQSVESKFELSVEKILSEIKSLKQK